MGGQVGRLASRGDRFDNVRRPLTLIAARQSPFRWGLGALQQDFCFARAEFARALVPKQREGTVALNTQLSPLQEGRIVGVPEPQRRLPITSLGGALVKKATGRKIARAQKGVTALQQHRHVSAGLIICAGDHSGRPCTWGSGARSSAPCLPALSKSAALGACFS